MSDVIVIQGIKKGVAYTFYTGLTAQQAVVNPSNGVSIQTAPTISAGMAIISKDGGSFNNLTNLPTATPPAGQAVLVSLTATEMNADKIVVIFTGSSVFCDQMIYIETSARVIDDLLYPTYPLIDSVPADGSIPNLQQSLYMIIQFLAERVVAGTTVSVKNPSGGVIMTFTLNDAANPTSITRTT